MRPFRGQRRGIPAQAAMIPKGFHRHSDELFTSKNILGVMSLAAVICGYGK
jgi:hypothetical protein